MNHEKINEYLTLLRQLDYSSDDALQDALLGKLDYIWWKELDEEDIEFINAEVKRSNDEEARSQQEKPVMLNVFENKEDYLKLKNFWQKYHADGKYKAVPVEYSTGIYDKETRTFAKAYHMESELGFRYHLVYLAATGKCISKATRGMWLETIEGVLDYIRWARKDKANAKNYFFDLFGEAIDEKYYDAILNRIDEYFTIEKKTYGQVK